ncbi:MAG: peroxidase [Planctomycetes bacterium]|nr:peroxidase [Planctomycetota bacterium]
MIGDDEPEESVSQLVSSLSDDYRAARLGHADLAMLTYVDKLTRTPGAMESADVAALRDAGFGEAAILDICQVAAYYAFVNRLAEGLGVELET